MALHPATQAQQAFAINTLIRARVANALRTHKEDAVEKAERKPPPKPTHKQMPMRVVNELHHFPKRTRINTFMETPTPTRTAVPRTRGFGEEEK